jgi:hypothetical protein
MARIFRLSPVANPGMHHLAAFLRGLLGMTTKFTHSCSNPQTIIGFLLELFTAKTLMTNEKYLNLSCEISEEIGITCRKNLLKSYEK